MRMFNDSLAHLEGQVQSAEFGVAKFEIFNNAKCLQVVVEELAVAAHCGVQCALPSVPKWRMPDVMHQRKRLDQVNIQIKRCSDGAGDLGDLDGVRHAGAEMVRV